MVDVVGGGGREKVGKGDGEKLDSQGGGGGDYMEGKQAGGSCYSHEQQWLVGDPHRCSNWLWCVIALVGPAGRLPKEEAATGGCGCAAGWGKECCYSGRMWMRL